MDFVVWKLGCNKWMEIYHFLFVVVNLISMAYFVVKETLPLAIKGDDDESKGHSIKFPCIDMSKLFVCFRRFSLYSVSAFFANLVKVYV